MNNWAKLFCRLTGALTLASVGLSAGYLLTVHPIPLPWLIPFAFLCGVSTGTGFFLIWLNRIERYRD